MGKIVSFKTKKKTDDSLRQNSEFECLLKRVFYF
jgi:hypothetical protein